MSSRVYLDHAATTPLLASARAAMLAAHDGWANPSSPHAEGRRARAALEEARARIAGSLGWAGHVILTGGASEGAAIAMTRARAGRRVIAAVEHDAVRRHGGDALTLGVGADGLVAAPALAGALATAGPVPLLAVQAVNSETGVIQPLDRIGEAVRAVGGLWLCDATQAAGKIALPAADFILLSAHKFGGPPGIGALLVRDLATLAPGGGQEQGYRGGTEALPLVVAMAAALGEDADWLGEAAVLRAELDAAIEDAGGTVIARDAPRLPTIASYRMTGVAAAAQLIRLDGAGFAVSAGSACSSGSLKASPVLAAMGLDPVVAGEVIRVSFGRSTRADELASFAAQWRAIAADARSRAA